MAWVYLIGYPVQLSGRALQLVGALVVLILGATMARGLFMFGLLGNFLCFLGASFAIFCGTHLFLFGRKITARRAEELMRRDERNPVLFLRSFRDDKKTSRVIEKNSDFRRSFGKTKLAMYVPGVPGDLTFSSVTTEEEMLANELKRIGPCIAVGSPGERLPPLGMARMYFENEHWEEGVREYIERADLVVMRAGVTDGFLRELRMAVKFLEPKRLLILLPSGIENEQAVVPDEPGGPTTFREIAGKILQRELPVLSGGEMSEGSLAGIIWFESDWTPKIKMFEGGTIKGLFEPLSKSYSHSGAFH
ncbi:MAG: hypothetical protein WCD76_19635 [Pyrinomonadaceae bacterium]